MPERIGAIEGSEVVDLYAGTGMLGIEAISRGAGRVTFVESNRRAVASIKRNLDDLGIPAGKYGIVHSEVGRFLRGSADSEVGSGSIFDIAFIDAPYDLVYSMPDVYSGDPRDVKDPGEKHATVIGGNVLVRLQASLAVIETRPGDYIIPSGWEVIKQRRYGGTMVTVLRGWH
jgi:16S rRNA (guanine966-N2)-methyltransferase